MAAVTKNLRDGVVTILDGTPSTPNSVAVLCDEGNFKMDFMGQRKAIVILDRGELSHLRKGDAELVNWSMGIKFKEFISQGSNEVTPYEALLRLGAAAAWLTTNADGGDVPTCDLQVVISTPTSGEDPEKITINKCFDIKCDFSEGDNYNVLNFSGKGFMEQPTIAKDQS